MFRSYRIGTLFGFPISLNLSFLIMLGVVLLWMGGLAGVAVVLLAFGSVLLHELGHAVVARKLGVAVAGIELHFFGGAAKIASAPKSARDEIAIAAAGPAVSFVLGGIGILLGAVTGIWLLELIGIINLIIGGFNLVPALPMDGGRILRAILTIKYPYMRATDISVKVARVFAIALGVYALASGQFYMAMLAVMIWIMGTAELAAARMGIGGYGRHSAVEVLPRDPASARNSTSFQSSVKTSFQSSVKTSFQSSVKTSFHRPIPSGGFVVRMHGNRLIIEPLDTRDF